MAMPAIPKYKPPSGDTSPTSPMAQRSEFYNANPWKSNFGDYNKTVGGYGSKLMGSAGGFSAAADNALSPGYLSSMNAGYPDINDPRTIASLQKWGSVLDSSKATEAMLPQIYGASIAGQRSGYGGAGRPDLASQLRTQSINTAANQHRSNVTTGMDYMGKLSQEASANARALAEVNARMYGDTLQAGQGMFGLNLQGLTAEDASRMKYLQDSYGAYNADVGDYNRWNEGDAQMKWDIKQRNQQANDAQAAKDRAMELDQMMRSMAFTQAGQPDNSLKGYAKNQYLMGQGAYKGTAGGGGGGYPLQGSPSQIKDYQKSLLTQKRGGGGGGSYMWGAG